MKNHLKRKGLIASRERRKGEQNSQEGLGSMGTRLLGWLEEAGCCRDNRLNRDPEENAPRRQSGNGRLSEGCGEEAGRGRKSFPEDFRKIVPDVHEDQTVFLMLKIHSVCHTFQ